MEKHDWITDKLFDYHLGIIVSNIPTWELLQIPGVYKALSEHFNNEVIKACVLEKEKDQP
jgi:hypothetical protein